MRLPLLALVAISSPAWAGKDTDYPHRDWGQVATLDMTVAEATACIAREKNRGGSATVLPVDGGNDIDFKASTGFFGGTVGEPWETFKVRKTDGETTLRVFYRHPYRQGGIGKDVANLRKRCLRVTDIRPA